MPGVIRESPIPCNIADNKILVKVHAWAMNPADAMVQDVPLPFIKYPLILGEDVAGTVESAGSAATARFQPGDRVLGLALGAAVAKPEQGAFQDYVILDHSMACKIPDSLSFAEASVFPLCIATAAHGLFSKDYLALPFPTTNTPANSTGKTILIWGGSSGVGSNAIQLSKAAGFEVLPPAPHATLTMSRVLVRITSMTTTSKMSSARLSRNWTRASALESCKRPATCRHPARWHINRSKTCASLPRIRFLKGWPPRALMRR